jgi:hypothetical protein
MSGIPQQGNEGAFATASEHFIPKPFTATTLLKALRDLLLDGKGEDKGVAA